MVQDQEWRKDAGCQWESHKGEKREEKRDVGCQSEPAESRDAAVQVDFRLTGVCDVPWQCTSVRLDEPGGVNTTPPLYPVYPPYTTPLLTMMPQFRSASADLQHLHLPRFVPSMPLYQPPLFLAQGTIPLPQYFPLPSMPMWNMPPSAGGRCDPSPPQTPMDSSVPAGLIAPLSPRLAEEEDEEEGFFLKHNKSLRDTKCSTVKPQRRKKNLSQCRAKCRPAGNKQTKPKVNNTVSRRRGGVCSTTHRKRSSEEKEKWQLHQLQDVLHPEERSSVTDTQQSSIKTGKPAAQIQHTSAEGGSEKGLKKKKRFLEQNKEQENGSMMMMEEEGRGAKREKLKMEVTKQVVRPRRNAVGPPIRYLIESEVRSCGLSVDDQSREKVNRNNGGLSEDQQEEEIEGAGVMEAKESSRPGSTEDSEMEGCWQPCQVCGLKFNKEASLQLHLSVHRTGRWFNCHLCSKRFRLAHTLCQHHRQYHHGNRGGHNNIGGRVGGMELTRSDNREVKFNTSSDTERVERSKEGEKVEEKLLLPPPTKSPDWLKRIDRVRRNPRWWVDFQSPKRSQENIEWWRMLQESDGGTGRKGKQSRKKEVEVKQVCEKEENGGEEERRRDREEMVEVKAVSLMKEGGVEEMEVKQVCATRKDGGEEEERRDGGENKEEVKLVCVMDEGGGLEGEKRDGEEEMEVKEVCAKRKDGGDEGENNEEVKLVFLMEEDGGEESQEVRQVEVMEHAQRPRRTMVGPPIRYLLESEEQSHCPITANQERLKLKKKTQSEAEGRASGGMAVTDRTENTERRPGLTNQDKANNPKRKRGRSKKVVIDSQGGGGVSEIRTGHLVSESQTDHLVSHTKKDYLVSDRQTGSLVSERHMGDMGLDKQVDHLVSERTLERQTCHLMPGGQTGHLVSDGQTGSLVSERQTGHIISDRQRYPLASERQMGDMGLDKQMDHLVSERMLERQTCHPMSGGQTGHLTSDGQIINLFLDTQTEGQTSHIFYDRQADPLVSERQTGHLVSERQMAPLSSEKKTGQMVLDKQMDHLVSDGLIERQTCHLMSGGQTGHLALDGQIINMFLDTQTERQTSDTLRKSQTDRQADTYRRRYLVYKDLQSGQVTFILPCSVRLQRLL